MHLGSKTGEMGRLFLLSVIVLYFVACKNSKTINQGSVSPNILWIVIDDVGTEFPLWGHKINTPNIDQLINEGTVFRQAFVTSPVSSPARSAMITGMYQTAIGANNHVSGRGKHRIHLPDSVKMIPQLFKAQGYYVTNADYPSRNNRGLGKADYNFDWDENLYDGNDWRERQPGQPFFAQIQLLGGKNRDKPDLLEETRKAVGRTTDFDQLLLPPYYPKDSVILQDWADYMDCIRYTDQQVGEILEMLEEEGVLENTLIILMGDNGISHARGKQFLYDEGVKVIFAVKGLNVEKGVVREDLIEHIDMGAISLAAAGIEIPEWMQGKDVFSRNYKPREYVYGARDRCGETIDRIRSVRSEKYKYIRNFYPERPLLQPSNYKDSKEIINRLRYLYQQDQLTALQKELLFAAQRPAEELYDIVNDPYETVNLVYDSDYREILDELRGQQEKWSRETNDPAPESFEVYSLEMENQWERTVGEKARGQVIARNIGIYKKWMVERKI